MYRQSHRSCRTGGRGVAVLLTAALLALTTLPALPVAAAEVLNRVVIRVNDRIATLYDYETRATELSQQIMRSELPLSERRQRIAEVPEQVFQELFQEMLLLSRADQAGIVFTEAELAEQTGRIQQSYGISSEEEFQQALTSQGLSERGFREQMERGMRIQELVGREVRGKLDVGEDLAREYYRDHPEAFTAPQRLRLREVVVLEDGALSADERRQRAEDIRQRRVAGEDLESLVEDGVTSGVIDLGWVTARDLADELEAAVWDFQAGAVSAPVDGRGGVHVLEVLEREEEGLRPFNEVADEARNRAGGTAFQEAMETYLEDLERASYIRLDPPPEAAGFRRLGTNALPVPPAVGAPAANTEAEAEADAEAAVAEDGLDPAPLTPTEAEVAQPDQASAPSLTVDPADEPPSPADLLEPEIDNDGNR